MVGCHYDRHFLKRPIGQYRSSVNFPDSKSAQIVCDKLGNISLISNLQLELGSCMHQVIHRKRTSINLQYL